MKYPFINEYVSTTYKKTGQTPATDESYKMHEDLSKGTLSQQFFAKTKCQTKLSLKASLNIS